MSYHHTTKIMTALAERLRSLVVPDTTEALFGRVGFFGANQMVKALSATFASEDRVGFIVPGGDQHSGEPIGELEVHSRRQTRLCLLIADRAFDIDHDDAVMGGPANVGVLNLKDFIIDELTARPIAIDAAHGFALVPSNGEPLLIENADKAGGNLGRECWQQWFLCYAGTAHIALPF